MNYLVASFNWFKLQPRSRQVNLAIGCIFILSITAFLSYWVMSPHYGVLFNHLDNRDANQILKQLDQAQINYKIRNQGSEILIAKPLIDKTRIQLMSSDLHFNEHVGFELFDKNDFGMTDFSQKINYQRALQGELERTISSLDEVRQVRVHLVIPEHHLFQQEQNQPQAAINLHLNHSLTVQQINGIQQLITASVPHLQKKNMTIVDQKGNSLINNDEDSALNHFAAKKNMEQYLTQKVMQMLKPIFANDEAMVKIDVSLNYDELQREFVKPQRQGIITHEKEIQHSTSSKAEQSQSNQDLTREKTYHFGSEKEQFKRASGYIERLTISVIVPQFTSQQTIQQIERLVKTVIGFNATRGDSISVEALIGHQSFSTLPPIPLFQPLSSIQTLPLRQYNFVYFYETAAVTGLFCLYSLSWRLRRRKRQLLLAELNQWLKQHE